MTNKPAIRDWVNILRSGTIEQVKGRAMKGNKLCAVAVFIRTNKHKYNPKWTVDEGMRTTENLIGLDTVQLMEISDMNDYTSATFNDIADFIERKYLCE